MIFTPYPDETQAINMIRKIRNEDYALIRMTDTMIDKNNLDANGILREMLEKNGLVDYEKLDFGGINGISFNSQFVQKGKTEIIKLKFYRVSNKRGDRRFSIETLKRRMQDKEINVGDLLYISVFKETTGTPKIFIVNLTHNTPTASEILNAVGEDSITKLLNEIKPKLREIINGGYYNNLKGAGKIAPKDVGDTLEHLLGIKTNNREDADYKGLIEIKSKGGSRTLDTLFTLRPYFDGTPVAVFEKNDRSRVSAFARLYGYDSEKHPGYNSLYITIGSKEAPQNNQGFYLDTDEDAEKVYLVKTDPKTNKRIITAYWTFADLKEQLYLKHPSTLWVKAESRMASGMGQFKYCEVEFSRAPQFMTFLSLIKAGIITYDWRGYTTKSGRYQGKNHGNAWRIKPNAKAFLFGEIERIDL